MLLAQQMGSGAAGTLGPSVHHTSKSNLTISDPIPGAKPLPVPPELAALMGNQQSVSSKLCVVQIKHDCEPLNDRVSPLQLEDL